MGQKRQFVAIPGVTEHFLEVVSFAQIEPFLVPRQVVSKYWCPEWLQSGLVSGNQKRVVATKRQHRKAEHATDKH